MATDSLVIEDVISMPGAISKVTTELIGPFLIDVYFERLRMLLFAPRRRNDLTRSQYNSELGQNDQNAGCF